MNESIIILIIIPLVGAFFCLLEKLFPRLHIAPVACVLAIVLCLLLLGYLYPSVAGKETCLYTIGGWDDAVGIRHIFDGFTWLGCTMLFLISLPILLFAVAEHRYDSTFYFFFLLMLASMVGVLLAADLFNMFVCFEILGITSYILIAYFQKRQAFLAGFNYLVLSSVGMAFFLLGILILYQSTGSLSLFEAGRRLAQNGEQSAQITFAVTALVAGISVRTAYMPFHAWLPNAHASAPHPVSAMLSGLVIKISFLAIWRILSTFSMVALQPILLWIGAVTALFGVIWALVQTDCKKLLAWHSISQIGYILAAFGGGKSLSLLASFSHVINHAVFKSLLFLCIGSVIHLTGERNLKHLGQLGRRQIGLAVIFLIAACSIAGVPPCNGFISKTLISAGLVQHSVIYSLLWLSGIGTFASFIKLSGIFRTSAYAQTQSTPLRESGKLPRLAYGSMIFLALLCLLSGIFGRHLLERMSILLFDRPLSLDIIFYSSTNLRKTLLSAGLGLLVYRGVISRRGRRLSARIRAQEQSLNASIVWCLLGIIGLTILASCPQ